MNTFKRRKFIIFLFIITILLIILCYFIILKKEKKYIWNINLETISKNNNLTSKNATEINTPIVSSSAVTFDVELPYKSRMVYDIIVQNTGSIDASFDQISGIDILNSNSKGITYKVDKLDEANGDIYTGNNNLNKNGGKNYFRVTIENNSTDQKTVRKKGTINIEYIQRED